MRTSCLVRGWSLALGLVVLGCHPNGGNEAETPENPASSEEVEAKAPFGSCPLGLPGARVAAEDTEEGIALIFTGGQSVAMVRKRVWDAAAMHGPGSRAGFGHADRHGGSHGHGLKLHGMPVLRAEASFVPGGARIDIIARSGHRDEVRARIRARVAEIERAGCE